MSKHRMNYLFELEAQKQRENRRTRIYRAERREQEGRDSS